MASVKTISKRLFRVIAMFWIQFFGSNAFEVDLQPRELETLVGNWHVNFTCRVISHEINETLPSNLTSILWFYVKWSRPRTQHDFPQHCIRQINSSMIELRYCPEALDGDSAREYYVYCYSRQNKAINKVTKVFAKLPHRNPKILESTCELYNWDQLTFQFDTYENRDSMYHMSYQAWYRTSNETTPKECTQVTQNPTLGTYQCQIVEPWEVVSQTDTLFLEVNGSVTEKYSYGVLETVTSGEVPIKLIQVLKPAKVSNISVRQNESHTFVLFQAPKLNPNITYNITIGCNKDAFYQSWNITRPVNALNSAWSFPNVSETSIRLPNSLHAVQEEVCELPPFSDCRVSINSISGLGGQWSGEESNQFKTLQKVPLANPKMCSSCFQVIRKDNDFVDVIMFFIPLSKEVARGRVIRHQIKRFDKNERKEFFEFLNQTNLFKFVLRNLSVRSQYEVGIQAETEKGYNKSLNTTYIIAHSQIIYPPVSSIINVLALNTTAVRASWKVSLSDVRHVYLFWCEGVLESKECSSALSWKQFFNSSGSEVIVATEGKRNIDFIHGIGIERIEGDSSGILWTDCKYKMEELPPKPRVRSTSVSASEITVFLYEPSCSGERDEPGLTVRYEVMICKVAKVDDERCLDVIQTLNFTYESDLTLSDLEQNQSYLVSIQSLTEFQKKSEPTVIYERTKLIDSWINVTIFIPIIFLAMFMIVVCIACFKLKPLRHSLMPNVLKVVIPPTTKAQHVDIELNDTENRKNYPTVPLNVLLPDINSETELTIDTPSPGTNLVSDDSSSSSESGVSLESATSASAAEDTSIIVSDSSDILVSCLRSGNDSVLPFADLRFNTVLTETERILPSIVESSENNLKQEQIVQEPPDENIDSVQITKSECVSSGDSDLSEADYFCIRGESFQDRKPDSSRSGESWSYIDGSARYRSVIIAPEPSEPACPVTFVNSGSSGCGQYMTDKTEKPSDYGVFHAVVSEEQCANSKDFVNEDAKSIDDPPALHEFNISGIHSEVFYGKLMDTILTPLISDSDHATSSDPRVAVLDSRFEEAQLFSVNILGDSIDCMRMLPSLAVHQDPAPEETQVDGYCSGLQFESDSASVSTTGVDPPVETFSIRTAQLDETCIVPLSQLIHAPFETNTSWSLHSETTTVGQQRILPSILVD